MAAWHIFGRDTTPEQLPADLRAILAEMKRERVAFEALANAARDSGQNLTQLMQPLTEAQKVVSELQARVKSLERLAPVLATLDEQTEQVAKSQLRTEAQLTQNSESAKQLRMEIDELRGMLEQALALKSDVAGLLELGGGFKALRLDADKLSGAVRELTQGFDQVRARQEELRKTSEVVATRFSAFEERQQDAQRSVAETESRTATVSQTLKELTQAAAEAAQTKRQLATLKALADGVTLKVAALEQQRDVVDRATAEVAKLHELMGEVDAKIRRHAASATGLGELESKLAALRDDLRGALTAMEGRFKSLEESSRGITDVRSKADALATQLDGIAENVALLGTQAERVRAMETSTGRLGTTVEEMTQRVAQLEKAHPGVQAALEDVATLRGTHEAVKGAMEQVQASAAEMARVREAQAGTKVWLTGVTEQITALRGDLAAVEELKPTVESVRGEADRLSQAMGQIEARSRMVDDLNKRLSGLTALGSQLEERSSQLGSAVTTAGNRLIELTTTLDELDNRAGGLRFAQKRMAQFEERLAKWEAVESQLARALEQMSQRQTTVDAMHMDMHRLYQVAEQTTDHVRSIAGAKEEVGQTHALQETVLSMVTHVHDAANGLDHRKRQVEQAEERLARADAMLVEVQAGLERLHG